MINTTHVPVMPMEVLTHLNIKTDGLYMDLTFGGGGHSRMISNALSNKGKLIAMDLYSGCEQIANEMETSNIEFVLDNYKNYFKYLENEKSCDGILIDLGFSSDTLNLGRGFSYSKKDEDLDMRYSLKTSNTAKRILNKLSRRDLMRRFKELEVFNFASVANGIVNHRKKIGDLKTTSDLITIIEATTKDPLIKRKTLKTVFQALRVIVNSELENLVSVLRSFSKWLKEDGRLVILCFNSIERKIVMKELRKVENPLPSGFPIDIPSDFELLTKKPLLPTEEEIKDNSRSKSACLIAFRRKDGK